jgi:leader peptidase (prepilin peptidase) / N-methyltransferase
VPWWPCARPRPTRAPVTALLAVLAGGLGAGAGAVVNRLAGTFPWGTGRPARSAVRPPVLEAGTAVLFVVVALARGPAWDLPAFLFLAGAGVLLAVVDLRHRLLPDRAVVPTFAVGALLLALAAVAERAWPDLLRAGLGAVVLFAVFLVLALISPAGLGMGDVKLAAVVGLYLGWLGWGAVVLGAFAGFVVQAVVALLLLASRRIGLKGELPFGPAMLAGAALAFGYLALV